MSKKNRKVKSLAAFVATLAFAQLVNASTNDTEALVKVKKEDLGFAVSRLSDQGFGLSIVGVDKEYIFINISENSDLGQIFGEGEFFAVPEINVAKIAGRCPPSRSGE